MVFLLLNPVFGQQEEQISFYQYNPLAYNPAFAGSQGKLSVSALGHFQWIQYAGAPRTQLFSIHSALSKNQTGIGANFKHDQIGKRKKTEIDLIFASALSLNANRDHLRLGLSLGLNQYSCDFSDAMVNDPDDPFITQQALTQLTPGFGISYSGKKHFIGFSVPHILPNKASSSQLLLAFSKPHYYLSGSYDFTLNAPLKLKVASLLKYVPHVPLTIDLNATCIYRDKLFGGLNYRFHEGLGINGLIQIKQQLLIGYSYEFPINGLFHYQFGSHELMLHFELKEKSEVEGIPKF